MSKDNTRLNRINEELKKEIETEGGEFYAEQSYGKIKDFI